MRYDFHPTSACNMCGGSDFAPFGMRLNGTKTDTGMQLIVYPRK